MRDYKADLAIYEAATKGLPFDAARLADMARWYMIRCKGLEVQLKCAEDANKQLEVWANAEIRKLEEALRCAKEANDSEDFEGALIAVGPLKTVQEPKAENQRLREALEKIQEAISNYSTFSAGADILLRIRRLAAEALKGETDVQTS